MFHSLLGYYLKRFPSVFVSLSLYLPPPLLLIRWLSSQQRQSGAAFGTGTSRKPSFLGNAASGKSSYRTPAPGHYKDRSDFDYRAPRRCALSLLAVVFFICLFLRMLFFLLCFVSFSIFFFRVLPIFFAHLLTSLFHPTWDINTPLFFFHPNTIQT